MTEAAVTEALLATVDRALERAARDRQRALPYTIVVALAELGAWLEDERQSTRARGSNWDSLLQDLLDVLAALGSHLAATLESDALQRDLRSIRRALPTREGLDPATLRRLTTFWREVDALTRSSEARLAALADLFDGARAGFDRALDGAATVLALGDAAVGEDDWYVRRLRDALGGSRDGPALNADERVERAQKLLVSEPQERSYVVWLRIDYAPLTPGGMLELGDDVCLFSEQRVRASLARGDEALFTTAPELRDDPRQMDFLVGDDGDVSNEHPAALLRVSFDSETGVGARVRAFQTAETIAGLACLYGAHPGTWLVSEGFASYVDGRGGAMSISADEDRRVPAYPALALQGDRAAYALKDLADDLRSKLPVRDRNLAEAGQLLHWLQQARSASPAARVLLYDRILEQVSGWAGVGEVGRFIDDYLGPRFARSRIRQEVANAAFGAHYILVHEAEAEDVLRSWCDPGNLAGPADLRAFLGVVDDVLAAVVASDSMWRRENPLTLERLERVAAAAASRDERRRWCERLDAEFSRAERRRRRTRNSLVHGGPLAAAAISSVVEFTEGLALRALGMAIEGRIRDADLVDYFLTESRADAAALQKVRSETPLAEALFD